MTDMRLLHHTHKPVQSVRSVDQLDLPGRKPRGFWVSVEGEDDWFEWCTAESYGIGGQVQEVMLSEDANILHLVGALSIEAFHGEYSSPEPHTTWGREIIDWRRVAEDYQGIIISPYVWSLRLDGKPSAWYYGWDCASGCIWDASTIAAISPPDTREVYEASRTHNLEEGSNA